MSTVYSDHNSAGQPGSIDPPGPGFAEPDASNVVTFSYSVPGRNGMLADSRTEPIVGATSYAWDDFNRRIAVTDPNGHTVETQYDGAMDRVRFVIERTGSLGTDFALGDPVQSGDLATEYVDDTFGDVQKTIRPRGNATAYGRDPAGRLTSVETKSDAQETTHDERVLFTLDDDGQRTREDQQVYNGSGWDTKASTGFSYTSRCHLDKVIHNPDAPVESQIVTEYRYDCDNDLEMAWDANHRRASNAPTQVYRYDALDRLSELREPWTTGADCTTDPAPAGCAVTSYGYDVQDHLASVIDAEGNQTDYTTSDRDLLTQESSPASSSPPAVTTHRYGPSAALLETIDPRGVDETREIDALDRVTALHFPDSTLDVTYVYDSLGSCAPESAPIGRLSSITRGSASIEHCWDEFGRMTKDGALILGYDENGNRDSLTYPGGSVATYGFDYADREESLAVDPGTGALSVVANAAYYPAGPLSGLTLGNGLVEARTYTSRYFPDPHPGPVVRHAGVRLELRRGRCRQHLLDHRQHRRLPGSRSFGYRDPQYFLTSATELGPDDLSWTYDRIGNRVTETRSTTTDTYVYTGSGHTPGTSTMCRWVVESAGRAITPSTQGGQPFAGGSRGQRHRLHDRRRRPAR